MKNGDAMNRLSERSDQWANDPQAINRRTALQLTGCGFGSLALQSMLTAETLDPMAQKATHFPAKIKRVIFLFMQGGPSQVDSFDYKSELVVHDAKQMPFDDARVIANTGKRQSSQRVMKSKWDFRQYGESGKWVSDLFPATGEHVDRICFLHGMQTEGVAHGPATLFLHCGATNNARPSMGSWLSYGLGTENQDLPAFVTISPSAGNGGVRNYNHAFLPAVYQGTPIGKAGVPFEQSKLKSLGNDTLSVSQQRHQLDLIRDLNRSQQDRRPGDNEIDALARTYELAWRMQNNMPHVMEIAGETQATQKLYGIDDPATADFGKKCLLARRLSESGVRFVQVTYGDNTANPAWDQHSNIEKHAVHAKAVDRPIAGLLADLAQRGLLEDTLVWWGAEFGRTPYAQQNGTGRDHNPGGFTMWLAGGGVKSGFSHGKTDDFGHLAVEGRVHLHDLHATILHLLGIDHEKLTYRYAGRDFRLTDVHGHVVKEILS